MDDQKKYAEENIHRMVQAGMGGQAQPDSALREDVLMRLRGELRGIPTQEFPTTVLGLITVVFALISDWWIVQSGSAPTWETNLIGILIGVNLLCIPLGSIVIVNRRCHV